MHDLADLRASETLAYGLLLATTACLEPALANGAGHDTLTAAFHPGWVDASVLLLIAVPAAGIVAFALVGFGCSALLGSRPAVRGDATVLTTIGGMRRAASRPDDRCMARLYDTVIAGCGAGGGTQACTLAPWGKQAWLLVSRRDFFLGINAAGKSLEAITKPLTSTGETARQTKQPRPQPLPHRRCRQPRWPTRAGRYPNA